MKVEIGGQGSIKMVYPLMYLALAISILFSISFNFINHILHILKHVRFGAGGFYLREQAV